MKHVVDESARTIIERGVGQVVNRAALERMLRSKKKLRVKLGIDPTAPDLHLGHAVVLRKLRQFQDAGHKAVLIIGDFTGQIGDPSGKSRTRPALSEAEVKKNMRTFLAQAGRVIDVRKAEVRRNGEWYRKGGVRLLLTLAQATTVQQVLKREDFKKRIDGGSDVSLLEALYAVLQGYDSVAVKADVELGGDDQLLNLLSGRRIQRHFGMDEQQVVTMPLLIGLDGEQKMSKSLGNYVGLTDKPEDMFGKLMSLPDALMDQYFELCTTLLTEDIVRTKKLPPRDRKASLAFEITRLYHGERAAKRAQDGFTKLFSKRDTSGKLPELKLKKNMTAVELVLAAKAVVSKSAAWRLVEQGGLRVNEKAIADPRAELTLKAGDVLRVGKRHFFRVRL